MNKLKILSRLNLKIITLFVVCLFVLTSIFFASPSLSASFDTALIRPSTHTVGLSPLPLLVSVRTSTIATEDAVTVTIPSGYQISSTSGNYTTSTSGLPSGFQSWPGMNTAIGVSGNSVTFPSGDLTPGVTYGFYITGGITSNPATISTAESVWQIRTLESAVEVDSSYVTVPVETSSSVTVTGTIPPSSEDFSVSIASSSSEILNQNEQIGFEVTYSTDYPTNTSLTLEASWAQGKIGDSITPSVDVAQYVSGSATTGYGGTAPVIDVVNRTITWNIPAMSSAAGDQTVSFSLVTTSNYQGAENVYFDVSAVITDPTASLPSTVTQVYKYDPPSTNDSSDSDSSSGSSSSGSSTSTSSSGTATPTPTPISGNISTVLIPTITNTNATVRVTLASAQAIEIAYGTSPTLLNQSLVIAEPSTLHTVQLANLLPDTLYYFRITSIPDFGARQTSELYSFRTASAPPLSAASILVNLSFQGIPLVANTPPNTFQTLILPENQSYELMAVFPQDVLIKTLRASIIYDAAQQVGSAYQVPFIKVNNNTYLLTFTALPPYGKYNMYFDVEEYSGNKQSIFVGSFRVVKPIQILDAQSLDPIEHVTIEVERYNTQLQIFEKLNLTEYGPLSQWQSNTQGIINAAFPNGRYRFTFTSPAYQDAVIDFEVSDETNEYPQVLMTRRSDFLFSQFNQYFNSWSMTVSQVNPVLGSILSSRNMYVLTSLLSLLLLSVGLLFSLSARMRVPVYSLPRYLIERLNYIKDNNKLDRFTVMGKVIDGATNKPLSRIEVTFLAKDGKVIGEQTTSANGYFHKVFSSPVTQALVSEEGYSPSTFNLPSEIINTTLVLKLKTASKIVAAEKKLVSNVKFVSSSLFEFLLLLICVAQFYFAYHIGIWVVLPFIFISILNVVIWTLYLSSHMGNQQFSEIEATKES